MHGDRGSVVIDNDKLTFIHLTPRDSSAEERAYGAAGHDQPDRRLPRCLGCCRADRRQQPWSTGNRPHRRQYQNFLAALEEALRVDLETNRQSIAIITGVYESAAPAAR